MYPKGIAADCRRLSAEIGGFLCAKSPEEHLAMYKEDEEAVFWSTPEEFAQKCFALLADEERRQRIAEAWRRRCMNSGYLNEPVMRRILDVLLKVNPGITKKTGFNTTTVP